MIRKISNIRLSFEWREIKKIFAQQNGRKSIGAPDKLFGVSQKAKQRISEIGRDNVINSTIGVLLDDDGKLTVLDSVTQCIRRLNPEDYAAYAPILGTPEYIEAVKKAVFLDEMPEAFSRPAILQEEREL